jgi:hypothetical protein
VIDKSELRYLLESTENTGDGSLAKFSQVWDRIAFQGQFLFA